MDTHRVAHTSLLTVVKGGKKNGHRLTVEKDEENKKKPRERGKVYGNNK